MPQLTVDKEQINVFKSDDTYLFTHYFDDRDLFSELEQWYNQDKYGFEVSHADSDQVRETLEEHFFDPVIVEDAREFCVAKDRESEHKNILENSVDNWTNSGQHIFIMKDKLRCHLRSNRELNNQKTWTYHA